MTAEIPLVVASGGYGCFTLLARIGHSFGPRRRSPSPSTGAAPRSPDLPRFPTQIPASPLRQVAGRAVSDLARLHVAFVRITQNLLPDPMSTTRNQLGHRGEDAGRRSNGLHFARAVRMGAGGRVFTDTDDGNGETPGLATATALLAERRRLASADAPG
jgi:hypothetical protein